MYYFRNNYQSILNKGRFNKPKMGQKLQNLRKSIWLVFTCPSTFLVLVLLFGISLLYSSLKISVPINPADLSAYFIVKFLLIYLMSVVLFLIGHGWMFAVIKHLVVQGKDYVSYSFGESTYYAWKLFKITLCLYLSSLLLLIPIGLVAILMGALSVLGLNFNSGILGAISIAFFLILILLFFLIVVIFWLELTPILILEDKGAIASLKLGWSKIVHSRKKLMFQNMGLAMGLFVFSFIPLLAYFIYYFVTHSSQLYEAMLSNNYGMLFLENSIFTFNVLSLPITLMVMIICLFYCLEYRSKIKQ